MKHGKQYTTVKLNIFMHDLNNKHFSFICPVSVNEFTLKLYNELVKKLQMKH